MPSIHTTWGDLSAPNSSGLSHGTELSLHKEKSPSLCPFSKRPLQQLLYIHQRLHGKADGFCLCLGKICLMDRKQGMSYTYSVFLSYHRWMNAPIARDWRNALEMARWEEFYLNTMLCFSWLYLLGQPWSGVVLEKGV